MLALPAFAQSLAPPKQAESRIYKCVTSDDRLDHLMVWKITFKLASY